MNGHCWEPRHRSPRMFSCLGSPLCFSHSFECETKLWGVSSGPNVVKCKSWQTIDEVNIYSKVAFPVLRVQVTECPGCCVAVTYLSSSHSKACQKAFFIVKHFVLLLNAWSLLWRISKYICVCTHGDIFSQYLYGLLLFMCRVSSFVLWKKINEILCLIIFYCCEFYRYERRGLILQCFSSFNMNLKKNRNRIEYFAVGQHVSFNLS